MILTMKDIENKAVYEDSYRGIGYTYDRKYETIMGKAKDHQPISDEERTYVNDRYNRMGLVPDLGMPSSDSVTSTTKSAIAPGKLVFLTRVMFSKIVPLYQYEVEYQIRNYDEKSRQDVLIGGSTCDAYDVKQRYIDQLLESVLPLYGFTLLSPKELMITLFDYKYPNELEKKPVTVGELVFGRMNWDLV